MVLASDPRFSYPPGGGLTVRCSLGIWKWIPRDASGEQPSSELAGVSLLSPETHLGWFLIRGSKRVRGVAHRHDSCLMFRRPWVPSCAEEASGSTADIQCLVSSGLRAGPGAHLQRAVSKVPSWEHTKRGQNSCSPLKRNLLHVLQWRLGDT